jgi:hypothetical protein
MGQYAEYIPEITRRVNEATGISQETRSVFFFLLNASQELSKNVQVKFICKRSEIDRTKKIDNICREIERLISDNADAKLDAYFISMTNEPGGVSLGWIIGEENEDVVEVFLYLGLNKYFNPKAVYETLRRQLYF